MKAVKDLCVRLIERKTYSEEEITSMVSVYREKNKLTVAEYDEVIQLIKTVYEKDGDK